MSVRLLVLACSDFCLNSLPCSVGIICILKTKTDTANNVSHMGSVGETFAMNVYGKVLPCFVGVY